MAVADFNGDGKPDIAYADYEMLPSSGVALGNGDGTFRPGVTLPLTHLVQPSGLFTADFNGDGKPDIIFFLPAQIALGNGDATFGSLMDVSECTSPPVVADVNRDGKTDLICGTSVLLSNGDGTFVSAAIAGLQSQETTLLAADFNKDGNPDLLLQGTSGQLAVALGRGNGVFSAELPVAMNLSGPTAGDFNGDERIDLVGACAPEHGTKAASICVLPGAGDGTFLAAVMTSISGTLPGALNATADFNRDGKLDLVAGNAVFEGNGDGSFRVPIFVGPVTHACGAAWAPSIPDFFPCLAVSETAVAADFNGDGLSDIAVGTLVSAPENAGFSSFDVLLNDSPGDGFLTAGISSASLTWPIGPGSIASAFGVNLAPSTEAASGNTLPTTLGGIRLHVQDRSHAGDMLAQLLYVSPTQINYINPSSDSFAWIGIERVGSPYIPKGIAVPISAVAPDFYSVGSGLAAGSAVSVAPDGTQTFMPVISCAGSACSPAPLDLSGFPVYLSLYGTGFAQAIAALSSCAIAGQTLPVSYAGPQMQTPGLDQVNLLLPKTLMGSGATSITCQFESGGSSVAGNSNAVNLTVR